MKARLFAASAAKGRRGLTTAARRLRRLVAALTVIMLAGGLVVAMEGTAWATNPAHHNMATWNMNQGPSRWTNAYDLSRTHDVIALQEVPIALPTIAGGPEAGGYLTEARAVPGVEHYRWRPNGRDPEVHLYIMRQQSRNLGFITRWRPDAVVTIGSVYRESLGVVRYADQTMFASMHAATGGGNDAGALVRRIADTAAQNPYLTHWVALGDYNRHPSTLGQAGLPAGSHVYNPGRPTHQNGGEYDYAVSNFDTPNWRPPQVMQFSSTDHWAVRFGRLAAAAQDPSHVTVMPLGDELTRGHNSSYLSGFRYLLLGLLALSPLVKRDTLDFVGSQRSGEGTDNDHEGYEDHTIDQLADRASIALSRLRPNVVTLTAGSLDVHEGDAGAAAERMGRLIDQIHEAAPGVTVLVADLPVVVHWTEREKLDAYNRSLSDLVAKRQAAGRHVALISLADLTQEDMDTVRHPNGSGYEKIARAFHDGIVGAILYGWIEPAGQSGERPLRAMALGSSSTFGEGSTHGNGYRADADRGFRELAGGKVDWVGSVRVGTMADRDVEGWRGRLIHEIAGKARCAVDTYQPNLITLIAGGNDVIRNHEMDGAIGRLEDLIWHLELADPGVTVLVAGVQPLRDPAQAARREAFNAQIPAMVEQLETLGVRVIYTDTSNLTLADIGSDGIHPTDQGYAKIGAAFVKAAAEAKGRGYFTRLKAQAEDVDRDPCGMEDYGEGLPVPGANKLGPNWEDRGVIQAQQFPSSSRFWMIDINKDRKAEFVTVDDKQNFRFWWNSGPSGDNAWTPFVEGVNAYKPPAGSVGNMLRFADLDGDGFPDCAVVHLSGRIDVRTWKADNPAGSRMCMNQYEGVASVFTNGSEGDTLTIDPATKIRFADVTGGGRDDYLLIDPDGTTTAWYNRDFQVERTYQYLDWAPPDKVAGALQLPREIRYADINADKRADRILITAKGGARAWINEGAKGAGGTYRDIGKIADDGDLPPKDIQFADIDADGKADFLRIGWTGVTHAWLNKMPKEYFDTFHP
ncbi:hypothetical protein C1I98_05820 [Spongiactinospora gelatinilytica]|uniref:SGNH hydrolase-type esterase domain-containing protein n=1 Tax=Spongiactinospora gelatinilytica TaxID=2666298 RepID=A0A2W2HE06_9ACTN|nr:GDSL-type esterase/lipase family protein [Spongiactinospora gelatinilytica]PZG53199.1 hypothetical protein C1I98_05820 [Spongiactinospora gelatinilytica]